MQNLYDIWKFIGVLNYHFTLTLMIAYYVNSNFASQYLLDIFGLFLIVRPALIGTYTTFVTFMEAHKTFVSRTKYVHQKKIDERNFAMFADEDKNGGGDGDHVRSSVDSTDAKKRALKQ